MGLVALALLAIAPASAAPDLASKQPSPTSPVSPASTPSPSQPLAPACSPDWTIMSSPNATDNTSFFITSVATVNASDAWAVGFYLISTPVLEHTLARSIIGEYGVTTVAVSMGKEGAIFVEGDEAIWAVPPDVEVKSTVGAGDAMVARIVAAKLQGFSLSECARLATAFSMDALTHIGSGLSSVQAVHAAEKSVILRPLIGELLADEGRIR